VSVSIFHLLYVVVVDCFVFSLSVFVFIRMFERRMATLGGYVGVCRRPSSSKLLFNGDVAVCQRLRDVAVFNGLMLAFGGGVAAASALK